MMDVDGEPNVAALPPDSEAVADPMRESLEAADEVADVQPEAAEDAYARLLSGSERTDEVALKVKDEALYRLAKLFVKSKSFDKVLGLLQSANPLFAVIPKAKTAKIVRTVIEITCEVEGALEVQIGLCQQVVAWCIAEKRSFLRQRVQSKLAALLFKAGQYSDALTLVNKLIRELKKLDDKQLLVEVHLVESRIQHALRNVPKAKAALTTARTHGNAIYVVPLMQGEIDHMSGTLCCEEGDYNTAHSYFLEGFEGFANVNGNGKQGDPRAGVCLKHMMLCKVLQGAADEVPGIAAKWGLKHKAAELAGLTAIAQAAKRRSLEDFDAASLRYSGELRGDMLVSHHLGLLYETMLEANLLKIVEPFSCVELARIAELIHLPLPKVERKLSQMILDKKLRGILDQGNGTLIVYDEAEADGTYGHATTIIANMEDVVASLYKRAQKIN
jgi:26S proteasome regulatory subunit N6